MRFLCVASAILILAAAALAADLPREVSADGHQAVIVTPSPTDGLVSDRTDEVPYGTAPDWQNSLRRQVGGLQVADLNGDGWNDVVVGCYISNSFPPYTDWENLIYYNTGGQLEANPSWISADEVSTGDVKVALINDDAYPDIFAANGGASMSPSVIYFGGPDGPATTPGWSSSVPSSTWCNYALPFDIDHDGDIDVITANQGNSPQDGLRPLYAFINDDGVLATTPGWQSAEASIQNYLAMGDWDRDGWEDLAVSHWVNNAASGIYANRGGQLETTPIWTTGTVDTDKGVAWADVDGDQWPDLALGHDPTQLWRNHQGTFDLAWSAEAPYFGHSDIAFCDVDRDGDQDLAEDHFSNGQVRVYLNRDGVLDSAPSWIYDSPTVGTALAFGDLNGDQWPDLVVGNSGEPCVKVFYAVPSTTPVSMDVAPRSVLHGAAPNPFNPRTTVAFTLAVPADVTLRIHDAAGRLVRVLASGEMLAAGRQEIVWDGKDDRGRDAPTGSYVGQLTASTTTLACKLLLVR